MKLYFPSDIEALVNENLIEQESSSNESNEEEIIDS